MRRKDWRLLAVWGIASILVLATGCAGDNTPATTSLTSTSSAADGITSDHLGRNSGATGDALPSTTGLGTSSVEERRQYVGDAEGKLAAELDNELMFSKARPLYDGFVYTLEKGYEALESYQDETGFVCKMEEFHFYPQINDTSDEALKFNEAMQKRLQWDYDQFLFRSTQKSADRRGSTYRAYRHGDLVSIVFIEWSYSDHDLYAKAFSYVYDQAQNKFLNKKEIIAKAGLREHEFSELFDAWYASAKSSVSVYDTKRIYAPGLLQMWAYDYHLPLGEWVEEVTQTDANLVTHAGVMAEHYPEYGLFFDDAGGLMLIKQSYEVENSDAVVPDFRFLPDVEGVNWLRDMSFPTEELGAFHTLAEKAGGEQSQTQAFVVFLGNKRDPEVIKRRLAAAAEIPGMELNLYRTISNVESLDGEIEMYLVIPRYTNSVMGIHPSSLHWEYNANFGPAIVIKDGRESFLEYVYRGFYSNVMLQNDMNKAVLDAGRDEGGFVDVTELVGESEVISDEIEEFVRRFYDPWIQNQ